MCVRTYVLEFFFSHFVCVDVLPASISALYECNTRRGQKAASDFLGLELQMVSCGNEICVLWKYSLGYYP